MTQPLRWGLLGLGGIATTFAKNLAKVPDHGVLAAAGSRSQEKSQAFCDEHGGSPYGSYQAVLDDPTVEAIYIALPNHLHAEWAIRCAEAGKVILCEKPACLTADELDGVLAACAEHRVFFMEAFAWRTHRRWQHLRELIAEGAIGPLRHIDARFGIRMPSDGEAGNIRSQLAMGGGTLMDVGAYPLSFTRLIAGTEPDSVDCQLAIPDGQEVDRWGSFLLRFPGDVIGCGQFGNRSLHPFTASIHGDDGWIEVEDPYCFNDEARSIIHRPGQDDEVIADPDGLGYLSREAVHVAAHCREGLEAPAMTWDDSRGQARAMDALRHAGGLRWPSES